MEKSECNDHHEDGEQKKMHGKSLSVKEISVTMDEDAQNEQVLNDEPLCMDMKTSLKITDYDEENDTAKHTNLSDNDDNASAEDSQDTDPLLTKDNPISQRIEKVLRANCLI